MIFQNYLIKDHQNLPKKLAKIVSNVFSKMSKSNFEVELMFDLKKSFRFMAKTCDGCDKKIIDETLVATNNGKHYHRVCYNNNEN